MIPFPMKVGLQPLLALTPGTPIRSCSMQAVCSIRDFQRHPTFLSRNVPLRSVRNTRKRWAPGRKTEVRAKTLNPSESALTKNALVTRLESALPKWLSLKSFRSALLGIHCRMPMKTTISLILLNLANVKWRHGVLDRVIGWHEKAVYW
jgi:hypothetical protein